MVIELASLCAEEALPQARNPLLFGGAQQLADADQAGGRECAGALLAIAPSRAARQHKKKRRKKRK
jgi:hypothetical protein